MTRSGPGRRRARLAVLLMVVAGVATADGPWPTPGVRKDAEAGRRGFDAPDHAMDWILQAHRDERGVIPRDGLLRARVQADAMRRASIAAEASGAAVPDAAEISRAAWTWIGPANIGGRVRALVIPPNAPSTILTGGVAGGIWKSTNGGASWRVIDDFLANLAVSCMVFRPTDPNRLFVGTGEGFFNSDSIRGAGIFASVNQGEAWSQLPSTANANFDFVNRLAFSSDGSILLAATRTGMFRSTDLGGSWSQVSSQSNMLDVKFIPGSSTQVVASGRNRNAFYSNNGGQSWTTSNGFVVSTDAMRVELAVSVSSPDIVYASLEEGTGQIWKSSDHGVSYTKVSDSAHLSTQGWYDNALWVDPTNPSHVIAGGVSLFRSTNGGVNFSSASSCHVDQHNIVHDPGYNGTTNRRVYFASDGGICKLEDVTLNTVTSLRNGLGITQFYGGDGLPGSGRIFGGTQDNGTLLYQPASGQNWTAIAGGDGGFSTADRVNNYLYGEFQWLQVHRSVNGSSSSLITGCSKPEPYRLNDGCTSSGTTTNFIAPILLDPNSPDRLLAGGRSLWLTTDPRTPNTSTTGPSWQVIKPAGTSNISAIAIAEGNSDIVWIGHSNGDVYIALDGTAGTPTWTKVDGTLPNRVITSIAISRTDPRIGYVSLGGFSSDSLWVTTNTGATWQDVSGSGVTGLPDVPVRSVVIHPLVPEWLYVATDVGVFASETGGATWGLPHDGPANVAVFQLFWMDATLVAVTHGRGFYTTPAASTLPAFARRPRSQPVIAGHAVAFDVLALGIPPLSYQWYRGDSGDTSSPIEGATSGKFTTPPIAAPANYWVRVTNPLGSADSNTATLTMSPWATLLPGVSRQGGPAEAGTASISGVSGAASAMTPISGVPTGGSPVNRSPVIGATGRSPIAWAPPAAMTAASGNPSRGTGVIVTGSSGISPAPLFGGGSIAATRVESPATLPFIGLNSGAVTTRGSAVAGTRETSASAVQPPLESDSPSTADDAPRSNGAPNERRATRSGHPSEPANGLAGDSPALASPPLEPAAVSGESHRLLPATLIVLGLFIPAIIVRLWLTRRKPTQ